MYVFKNGIRQQTVSVNDRAFLYGDGCFTTMCVDGGHIQLWERHCLRIQYSVQQLLLDIDWVLFKQAQEFWKKYCGNQSGVLKILVSRGESVQRGYGFNLKPADLYFFLSSTNNQNTMYEHLQAKILTRRMGLTMPCLVGIKSLNRLEQVLLKQEAQQLGVQEAFVLDVNDDVIEGVSSNVFLYVDDKWVTPCLSHNGVHGVMRAEILYRMAMHSVECEQKQVSMDDLHRAKSAFFCNALHPMQAVTQIEQQYLNCDITQQLFHTLHLNQIS